MRPVRFYDHQTKHVGGPNDLGTQSSAPGLRTRPFPVMLGHIKVRNTAAASTLAVITERAWDGTGKTCGQNGDISLLAG